MDKTIDHFFSDKLACAHIYCVFQNIFLSRFQLFFFFFLTSFSDFTYEIKKKRLKMELIKCFD